MSKNNDDYGWIGWVVAIIIGAIILYYIFNSSSEDNTVKSSYPATEATIEAKPSNEKYSWQCVDATSYNQNAYDDNRCTKGTETQYVSDSEAIDLDPSYSPGKAGASYYNNR